MRSRSVRQMDGGSSPDLRWFAASGLGCSFGSGGWSSSVHRFGLLLSLAEVCAAGRSSMLLQWPLFLTFGSSLRGPYSVVSVVASPISVCRFSATKGVWWSSCHWPPDSMLGLRSHSSITYVCLSSCGGVA
ncbi:hypothetical protein HID58_043077 [Brassica napus]|uniref:Uncharacterized protein n=1 Tax=Brassica napus TaxID=3708 RepID=A0ABQ8BFF8_BRANA|nr:hypothetical protein HID58_043077 [Brassica napus]